MANEVIDFTPIPRSLESDRHTNLGWKDALGELIDNSFDAGALRVEVIFGSKSVDVIDDGRGCGDITGMLTKGRHTAHPTTRLGRYGVGLKDTATWLWGCLKIQSIHRGKKYLAVVDWDSLVKQTTFTAPAPLVKDATGEPAGMRLTFTRTQRKKPSIPGLAAELSKVFMPALIGGRQIAIRNSPTTSPTVCQPFKLPPLDNVIEDEFDVDGRAVKIRVGVVQLSQINPLRGFMFIHGHRMIQESALGACGMPTGRVCGIVELGKGWTLSRNKNSIVDDDQQEALEAALHSRILPALEAGQQQATQLTGDCFRQELNARFKSALQSIAQGGVLTKKEKRQSPENNSGGVAPKETGRKRRNAKQKQPGESIADKAGQMCKSGSIEWRPMQDDVMGEVDMPGSVIYLNENNATLQELRAAGNTSAVLLTALALFGSEVVNDEQKARFPSMRDMSTFPQIFAYVAATIAEAKSESTASDALTAN